MFLAGKALVRLTLSGNTIPMGMSHMMFDPSVFSKFLQGMEFIDSLLIQHSGIYFQGDIIKEMLILQDSAIQSGMLHNLRYHSCYKMAGKYLLGKGIKWHVLFPKDSSNQAHN